MTNVVNLNKFRKRRAAKQAQAQADRNAQRHGRTRTEREQADLERQQLDSELDGARRDPPDDAD